MADISKIKLANGTTVTIKDATGRANLATLLGDHGLSAIGAAGWLGAETAISAESSDSNVATAKATKAYVDAQVGAIKHFEVKIYDELPVASKDTMYIIALVKDEKSIAGSYIEYITVETEVTPATDPKTYTYAWEQIGSTEVDLSDYVKKSTKIAGIDLQDDITVSELQVALGLGNMAYADTASGSTSLETIDSITMKEMTVAGNATVTSTNTAASLTKADYTPAGSVTVTSDAAGAVLTGGSIAVTVKDASEATAVSDITYESYTPAGTIAATTGGSFSALKSATFGEDSADGVQIAGDVSKPAVNVDDSSKDTFVKSLKAGSTDAASFTEGAFTAASIDADKFFNAGSQASYSHSGFSGGSLGNATKSAFATEGLTAAIGTAEGETETLIFSAAGTSNAVTEQGEYTAAVYGTDSFTANTLPSIDVANGFHGGSKAADTFSAEKLPVVDGTASAVIGVTAALAEAPVFTGKKYKVATTDDTALKTVAFTGTAADIKFSGAKYLKQEINTATFTADKANLGFSGTKVENALVTGVNYDKADANAAYSVNVTPEVSNMAKTSKTISVTVLPDSK